MQRASWQKRILCWLLVAVLMLIFCSAGHECHGGMNEHCPVCLVLSAWKLVLPGVLALTFFACLTGLILHTVSTDADGNEKYTLVSLKVKLSD